MTILDQKTLVTVIWEGACLASVLNEKGEEITVIKSRLTYYPPIIFKKL